MSIAYLDRKQRNVEKKRPGIHLRAGGLVVETFKERSEQDAERRISH
jgi:hypothetical protein